MIRRVVYAFIVILSVTIASNLIFSPDKLTTLISSSKDTAISASLDNFSPSKNSTVSLTVKGPPMANVTVVAHFKTKSVKYPGMIGKDGYAVIPIHLVNAEPGFTVIVDVEAEQGGKIYKTSTSFTPR